MTRTITAFAAAVALSALGAVAAQAEPRTLTVHTAGYNLNTPDGAKAFYRYLSQTVSAACGGAPTSQFTSDEERFQACYKGTMKAVVDKIHAPMVSAVAGQSLVRVASR
jgi:UrcA family protein